MKGNHPLNLNNKTLRIENDTVKPDIYENGILDNSRQVSTIFDKPAPSFKLT